MAAIVAAWLLSACASAPELSPAIGLAGSQWSVERVNGTPAQGSLHFDEERFAAFFGCNRMSGNYRIDRQMLVVGAIEATQMYCTAAEDGSAWSPMDVEAAAATILGDRPQILKPAASRLILRSAAGSIELSRP